MDAMFLILDQGYAGGAEDCIEKIQCPAGFVSAHAAVVDAYRERHNTDAAVWNGCDRIAGYRSGDNDWPLRH